MAKSKFFRVAVEGATTDGRVIERAWISEMAASYNPETYGARVNMEHIRGYSAEAPFNAYGDVLACEAREVDITLNGNQAKAENAIVFEADIIDAGTIDLSIEIELTERVGVQPRLGGGFEATHFAEPVIADSFSDAPAAPLREIYDAAGTLLVAAI